MIGSLEGTIISILGNTILISVHGVGYKVSVPIHLLRQLKDNSSVFLYIYTHVQDRAIDLYGFQDREDIILYEKLISVSGVGPKTALLILSSGTQSVKKAIMDKNVSFFTSIPRVGTKNAQKIIIELSSKLKNSLDITDTTFVLDEAEDVVQALIRMGFSKTEAKQALSKVDSNQKSIEEKLRQAFKLLAKK
ncbi:Holliday junction branch migration protein RuvA [Candidatus Gottesmanbacteria bacterium]|nr:Holliday junction branch migration protein RuvA [Candidatus Gottesmanbacteria bacterium]